MCGKYDSWCVLIPVSVMNCVPYLFGCVIGVYRLLLKLLSEMQLHAPQPPMLKLLATMLSAIRCTSHTLNLCWHLKVVCAARFVCLGLVFHVFCECCVGIGGYGLYGRLLLR